MNSKELILKRLLENKHITIEEMFILNQVPYNKVIIKQLTPLTTSLPWVAPSPYWYNTITCNTNSDELKNSLPSDYKMD